MDNQFRKTMKQMKCGNNMFPHCLKFFLDPHELLMMLEFCEDVNDDRNNEIVVKRAKDIGWSQRNFVRVFKRLKSIGLVSIKIILRGSEIRINYDAIKKLDWIMYEHKRMQYKMRKYTGDRNIMEITRKEISEYDRIERKLQKESINCATSGTVEDDDF